MYVFPSKDTVPSSFNVGKAVPVINSGIVLVLPYK